MAAGNISLPEPLLAEIQSVTEAQHRTPDELAADAIRQYLKEHSWVEFVERNARRAKEMGISEGDVDRLITEYRSENPRHAR